MNDREERDREVNRRKKRKQKRFQESLQRTSDFILQNEEDKFEIDSFEIDLLIKASKARQEEASERLGIIMSNLTNTELNDRTKKEIAIIIKLIKDSILNEIEADEMIVKNANNR